ncbi:hypothetical protein VULLAG_LOCUS12866 [Vulpes lagopus]
MTVQLSEKDSTFGVTPTSCLHENRHPFRAVGPGATGLTFLTLSGSPGRSRMGLSPV